MQDNAEQEKKIRNPELSRLLQDLTESFLDALDKPFFPDYGSGYERIKALLRDDGTLIARILEKRSDLEEEKLSRSLLSSQKCLKALLSEDLCRKPPHASTTEGYHDELALFLENLLLERERLRSRASTVEHEALTRHLDDVFHSVYQIYENYLYDDSVCDFLICPIQNFVSSKSIDFGSGLEIRTIKQREFHSLVEVEKRHGYRLESYPEFVLYVAVNDGNWREHIERVVTTLRLLKKERVGLTRIYQAYALPFRSWEIIEPFAGTKIAGKLAGGFFNLTSGEEDRLAEIFKLVERAKKAGYLAVSMRRFNLCFERKMLEDSWIDLFVSLESLYSKASEMTEVTHRLATRVSRALAGSLEERKQLRGKIKDWYAVRSKIVHGSEVRLNEALLQDLEETVRKSLKWFMAHVDYADHDKIIDLLDLSP